MDASGDQAPGSAGMEGKASTKRSLPKTPLQKEVLEASFTMNAFPSEEYRRALGERIELTEQQVQAWFINRRRRDKKQDVAPAVGVLANGVGDAAVPAAQTAQASRKTPAKKATPRTDMAARLPPGSDLANGSAASHRVSISGDNHVGSSAYASHADDYCELIEAAKATIPGYREDGPELGFVFDEIPSADSSLPANKRKKIVFDNYVAEADELGIRKHEASSSQDVNEVRVVNDERFNKWERERAREEAKRTKEAEKARIVQERELKKQEVQRERERKAEEKKKAIEDKKREREMAKAMAHQDKQLTRLRQWHGGGPPDDLDLEWERLTAAAGFPEPDQVTETFENGSSAAAAAAVATTSVSTPGGPAEAGPTLARPAFPPATLDLQPAFPAELGDELGGEMLMVWNFLYSFSDVLGVSAPSLDDLVHGLVEGRQAHVLTRLHIALLRVLQADMEEAYAAGAAMATGPGNFLDRALAFYGSMLEEAWGWGFDVDAWRAHLNSSTWPEVLRQVAIMSGAGAKRIKPQRGGKPKMGLDGEDVATSESGDLTLRLPSRFGGGTMKAAAWLVLSEAGPAGLLVSEIAWRMQKQGLRDLKTTKTPEASIAGAMSRDVVFVRVAPSTFALQSVITHQRRLLGGKLERMPPPKDAPAAGGTATEGSAGDAEAAGEVKAEAGGQAAGEALGKTGGEAAGEVKAAACDAMDVDVPPGEAPTAGEAPSSPAGKPAETAAADSTAAAAPATAAAPDATPVPKDVHYDEGDYSDSEDEDDDENGGGRQERSQPWLHALLSHDYDELALPDRLGALSFLISLVVNGPTVRAKLDDRAEQATKLKKALLEEVKHERRSKKPGYDGLARKGAAGDAAKPSDQDTAAAGGLDPSDAVSAPAGTAGCTPVASTAEVGSHPGAAAEDAAGPRAAVAAAAARSLRAAPATPEAAGDDGGPDAAHQGDEDEEDDNKRHSQRIEALRKVDDDNLLRMEPLGLDRRHNRYWRFVTFKESLSDPCTGRIFIEDAHDGSWRLLNTSEQLEALKASLDPRGVREMELVAELERVKDLLAQCMPAPPLQLVAATSSSAGSEEAAPACVHTQAERYLPTAWEGPSNAADKDPRLVRLSRQLLQLEAALPPSAIIPGMLERDEWLDRVVRASSPMEMRSCLGELEAVLVPGFLAKEFVRVPRVLHGVYMTEEPSAEATLPARVEEGLAAGTSHTPQLTAFTPPEPLSWLPPTYSAIALRLATLDASLLFDPSSGSTGRDQMAGYRYVLRPAVQLPDNDEPITVQELDVPTLTAPVLPFGRIRPLQLMPHLPGHIMCATHRDFLPTDVEELRRSVEQADELSTPPEGSLQPWRERTALSIRLGVGKTKGAAGKAAAAGAVHAGASGKKNSKAAKSAAASKAAKNKKRSRAREMEVDSDKDYGDDYDDGLDDILVDGPKYAYNPVGHGAASDGARSGNAAKAGSGPGQLYSTYGDEDDQ